MMKFVEHLEGLISSKVELAKLVWSLLKLETRLAGLSVFPLLITTALLIMLFITTWITVVLLAGYLIMLLSGKFLIAICSILVINIGLLLFFVKRISTHIRRMSFEKTRACLRGNHELTEKSAGINCQDGNGLSVREEESLTT